MPVAQASYSRTLSSRICAIVHHKPRAEMKLRDGDLWILTFQRLVMVGRIMPVSILLRSWVSCGMVGGRR